MKQLGIYPRWETEDQILSRVDMNWEALGGDIWESDCLNLEAYARGENPFVDVMKGLSKKTLSLRVGMSLVCARKESIEALRVMHLSGDDSKWLNLLGKSFGYLYWEVRICQYWQASFVENNLAASLKLAVEALSTCLCVGWIDEAKKLAGEIKIIYERRRYFDVDHYPLYQWLLRVCFDHWGIPFNSCGHFDIGMAESSSELRLNEIFLHWRDENLELVHEHILWLCDYYTHRTKAEQWCEFGDSDLLVRFPALIMAWQRLREIRGLKNPPIDHPLMQPGYTRLRPAMPFYTDAILKAVLDRLRREEMPGLGNGRQSSSTDKTSRRGLFGRLFGRS